MQQYFNVEIEISIHAPTRGATVNNNLIPEWKEISIHAPTRGATLQKRRFPSLRNRFQSTLPREERLQLFCCLRDRDYFNPRSHERSDLQCRKCQSTHTRFQSTLPREERRTSLIRSPCVMYFNPRSHERSDAKWCEITAYKYISIHAPTRGATQGL